MPSFLKKAIGRLNNATTVFRRVTPDFTVVGNEKAKPADFDTRTNLPDGRPRMMVNNALLQEADTLVLIDDSGSMMGEHWDLVSGELAVVADVLIQNDPNGIDLFFLNHMSTEQANVEEGRPATGYLEVQNPDYILNKFNSISPGGGTPTPSRLGSILQAYLELCERMHAKDGSRPRPLNIIVWTDGDCSKWELKNVIIDAARRLDRINAPGNQCGIQFLQVGNLYGIEDWLKSLDDDLQAEANLTRDMVDTKKYSDIQAMGGFDAKNIVTVIVGALSKRHDRMNLASKA